MITEITDRSPYEGYTDKKKSDEKVLRDVFKIGDAWFNTGDYMRDIGFKHAQFVDRLGDTYRWKGENVSTAEVENVICNYNDIKECITYGVEIPNTNGRAGMGMVVKSLGGQAIDFKNLYTHMKNSLPHYTIPVFIRISDKIATTGTHKYKKTGIRDEGYDITRISDPVYVWLPGSDAYVELTEQIYSDINNGKYHY